MKKVFKLLSLFSLVILFSSNLFASSSSSSSDDESEDESELNIDGNILPEFLIRSKDGKKFKVEGICGRSGAYQTEIIGGGSINFPVEDGHALYINERAFGDSIRDIRFYCGRYNRNRFRTFSDHYQECDVVYELPANEVRPGFYIREGGGLSYLRLEEIHNF